MLYEVFWVFVIAFVFPRLATWRVAGIVLIATCVLECLQLVHVAWLDAIRATFLGAALLGNGFDVWDFSHYLIGSALGGVLLAALRTQRR
ncbi:MAG: DUF2809 domain-containing protein [Phycisphaerales bacterium]|nr:DUF2809 domain-containing protein [Phycisphaerales bacterium]